MTTQGRTHSTLARSESVGAPAFDRFIVVIGFLIAMGVFRTMLSGGSSDRSDGSTLFQIVVGSIYLAAIASLLLQRMPRSTFGLLLRAWPLVLLTLFALASTLWSQAPDATFRRSVALILTSIFALFIVVRFDLRAIVSLFAIAFAIFCVGGILAVAVPGFGISRGGAYAGAWQGLSGQKNAFGRTIAVGLSIMSAAALFGVLRPRGRTIALLGVALVLLGLSRSATSLVATVGGFALGTLFYLTLGGKVRGLKVRLELGFPILLIMLVSGALVVSLGWTYILEALGRDATLTGRVKLWEWALELNHSRRLLGSGYKAFWIDANTLYLSDFFAWDADPDGRKLAVLKGPDHSHSGYMDVLLELGYAGVALLAMLILSSLVKIRRCLKRGLYETGFFLSAMLGFLVIYAITEKSFLQQSEDVWLVFMVFYVLAVKDASIAPAPQVASQTNVRPYGATAVAASPTGLQPGIVA